MKKIMSMLKKRSSKEDVYIDERREKQLLVEYMLTQKPLVQKGILRMMLSDVLLKQIASNCWTPPAELEKKEGHDPQVYNDLDYRKFMGLENIHGPQYSRKDEELSFDFTLDLGVDPVLPWIWSVFKLNDTNEHFGSDGSANVWKHKEQRYIHFYPLGITMVITNGNHSTMTGIIKAEGIVKIDYIEDFSSYLDEVLPVSDTKYALKNNSAFNAIIDFAQKRKQNNIPYIYPEIEEYVLSRNKYNAGT